MSFFEKLFSKEKKIILPTNTTNLSTSTNFNSQSISNESNNLTNPFDKVKKTSNTLKYKAIIAPYFEISEDDFKNLYPEVLDSNGNFSYEKLYEKFKNKVKFFDSNLNSTGIRNVKPERHTLSHTKGGINYINKENISLLRSSATDLIGQIGRKILTGDFNLTTVSVPIKVMSPVTILQAIALSYYQIPYYMSKAVTENEIEKLKNTIISIISPFYCSCFFLKPLNSILGETYEMLFEDGSKGYFEQSSHHPPISHFQIYGYDKSYHLTGYSNFTSSAGFNSLSLYNNGKRKISFSDGTEFEFGFFKESFKNTLFGDVKFETKGVVLFRQTKSKDGKEGKDGLLSCKVSIGQSKDKPNDYIYGEIMLNNKVISVLSGSFMSHIDFDNVRYWDIRTEYPVYIIEKAKTLPSCSSLRPDRILLEERNLEMGQKKKEELENLQRHDRKMREKYKNKQ